MEEVYVAAHESLLGFARLLSIHGISSDKDKLQEQLGDLISNSTDDHIYYVQRVKLSDFSTHRNHGISYDDNGIVDYRKKESIVYESKGSIKPRPTGRLGPQLGSPDV